MIPKYTSFEKIMESTNRLPFNNLDGGLLIAYLKRSARKGLDIRVHQCMKGTVQEAFADGIMALTSTTLDVDFVFVKINGGKGLFGGQKSNILSFVGQVELNELMPGTSFKNFMMALSSINNVFRGEGLL